MAKHKRAAWTLAAGVAAIALGAFAIVWFTDITWEQVIEAIDRLNPILVLPLMALLPIVGFPIAVVYLVAGARFGPVGGGVAVALITIVHMVGTYLIARSFLRRPLERYMARKNLHLPEVPVDEQAMICVIAALVPGLPYVVRNYVLALAGVRLKFLLLVCVPIYVARSYVTILLGDMGSAPTTHKLVILVVVDVLKVAICAYVIWRLREHHRKFHAHDHDPEPESGPGAAVPPNAAAS